MSETRLEITRAQVRRGGQLLAYLKYSGKMVTVVRPVTAKAAGRLCPAGYLSGAPDTGTGLYDVWTALHPSVPTPSDTLLARGVPLAEALEMILLPPETEEIAS